MINNVVIAALATVGLLEFLKNFFKPKNKVWYAVLMLPVSILCYCCTDLLPEAVIGSILTIGCVQLGYQTLVQGFQTFITNITGKKDTPAEEPKEQPEGEK